MLLAFCELLASLLVLPSTVGSIDTDEVLQSELANRLALKVFDDLEELDLIEKTIVALNETVNRVRCPKGWIRIGRSCYTGNIGFHNDQWAARDECVRQAGKPDQENRISVATIRNPLELQSIAGLMFRMNLNRVQIKVSNRLTQAVLAFHTKLDELFLISSRYHIFSWRKFCTSISLENPMDLKNSTTLGFLFNQPRSFNDTESSCFLLDYTSLLPPGERFSGAGSQNGFRNWMSTGAIPIGGRCVLFYNENCTCTQCNHICKYSADLCAYNPICGPHGQCIDTLKKGIKCECNFLYGGPFCDKVTREGIQIIVCIVLVILVSCANSWILRRCCSAVLRGPLWVFRERTLENSPTQLKPVKGSSPLALLSRRFTAVHAFLQNHRFFRSGKGISSLAFLRQLCCIVISGPEHVRQPRALSRRNSVVPDRGRASVGWSQGQIAAIRRTTFRRTIVVGLSTLVLTTILLASTSVTQMLVFRSDFLDEADLQRKLNRSLFVVKKCQLMTSFVHENLVSFPLALIALAIFSCFLRRERCCRRCCNGRPGLPIPMEPFKTRNRLTTAIIFGLLACEVLKIFEELLFKSGTRQPLGILLDLSVRIGFVFLIGMRYYPLLGSLQLRRNRVCTGVACIYAWFDMLYVVVKQGFCMGFVPISTLCGLVDEARLRLELGTWYVIYGLIRNAPHFACLAFVTSEFTARFVEAMRSRSARSRPNCGTRKGELKVYEQDIAGYRKRAVTLAPTAAAHDRMPFSYASCWENDRPVGVIVHRTDEENFFTLAFSDSAPNHIYVRNLLRRHRSTVKPVEKQFDGGRSSLQGGQASKKQHVLRRLLSLVYVWRDDFRYSTIAVCTFVTAFVFLYYLACTLVFYHLSRTEGYGFVLNFYFKHMLNIRPRSHADGWTQPEEHQRSDSVRRFDVSSNALTFWREICTAGLTAYVVFAIQMFHSMKQYRANKLMMYKGIFEDVPSARHLEPSKMIAQSVHYSGFLIGYMAWGFIIVFYLALLLMCTLSVLFRQRISYIATLVTFVVPVFMIYFLKVLLVRSTSKAVFTQGFGSKMALNNRKIHAVFVYFNFFFDCFLGVIACLTRLTKALLLNVLFMARLDYSFVGRPLERLDPGFSTYVAFLHTEVAHTHPVMVAFCDLLWRQIVLRRMGLISRVGRGSAGLPLIRPAHRERARFRWMLSYTLIRNGGLLSFRKHLTARLQFMVVQRYCAAGRADERTWPAGRDDASRRTERARPMLPPSIRVYSTTGVGDLIASAGERDADAKEKDRVSENSYLDDDETTVLLRPNYDAVPLVFETAPVSGMSQGAAAFLHYLERNGRLNVLETSGNANNLLVPCEEDTTTVLRMASYSERDALWRQGVRERVCSRSRYRYHYGCLSQLPAVKMLDLAHYHHLSSQYQRHLADQAQNDNYGTRDSDTVPDQRIDGITENSITRPCARTTDPSYASAQGASPSIATTFDEYGKSQPKPPVPPRSGSATTQYSASGTAGTGKTLLDPHSLLARLSSDFASCKPDDIEEELSFVSAMSTRGSLAQAFRTGSSCRESDSDETYRPSEKSSECKENTLFSGRSNAECLPKRPQKLPRKIHGSADEDGFNDSSKQRARSPIPPPLPPRPAGSCRSTPALHSVHPTRGSPIADCWPAQKISADCRFIPASPECREPEKITARPDPQRVEPGAMSEVMRPQSRSDASQAHQSNVTSKVNSPGKRSFPGGHYTSSV